MLASAYRFAVDNQSGAQISAASVEVTPWKFDQDGNLVYRPEGAHTLTFSTPINDNSSEVSTAVNNTTDGLYLGAHILASFTSTGLGEMLIYLQQSVDKGVTFPGQLNILLAVLDNSDGSPVSVDLEI